LAHLKTEQQNPNSRGLDRKSAIEILRVMNREDHKVPLAVQRELPKIAHAVDAIVSAMRKGGRLIYVGAGTSGRLAVLDASEIPPTFGTSRKMVEAIIAGGPHAVRFAAEGAEDSDRNGARDLARAGVMRHDVIVGIAASGTTPYVLGAIRYARGLGAVTVGVTSNRRSPLAKLVRIAIAPDTGPEIIGGSTRMKAGTAQKLVLNMLSTASMVRLGRTYENWMMHMRLTNQKLRRRGAQILQEAAGVGSSEAEHALRQAKHELPAAFVMLKTGASAQDARRQLSKTHGNIREALIAATKPRNREKIQGK
jgi:N-acetylmuramic acid 6-phosphate etherase